MSSSPSIFSCTGNEYAELMVGKFGKGVRHAKGLYSDFFRYGSFNLEASWIEPQARALALKIIESTSFDPPAISTSRTEGDVVKFLLRLEGGFESESVIIPMKSGSTLCISSQVGCQMGCAFCETGRMGLLRNLSVSEIVSQVFIARCMYKVPVRNIVFMGMGEPFDNFDAVMQAIEVLTCPVGLGFSPRNITVSTSGKVPEILRFSKEAPPGLHLAVSLNAPNDLIRDKLMPVNRKWNLQALKDAMLTYLIHPKREILIEYVLIGGVNDSEEDAYQVVSYLANMRVRVNLIPYNSQSSGRLKAPLDSNVNAFRKILKSSGLSVFVRTTKGDSIMAACGQLGNKALKKNTGLKSALPVL